jgi:acyl carrier protein
MNTLTKNDIQAFLLERYSVAIVAGGLDPATVGDDLDLLGAGIVDSFGVLEMISAVEKHFKIKVDFESLDPERMTVLGPFSQFVAENASNNILPNE